MAFFKTPVLKSMEGFPAKITVWHFGGSASTRVTLLDAKSNTRKAWLTGHSIWSPNEPCESTCSLEGMAPVKLPSAALIFCNALHPSKGLSNFSTVVNKGVSLTSKDVNIGNGHFQLPWPSMGQKSSKKDAPKIWTLVPDTSSSWISLALATAIRSPETLVLDTSRCFRNSAFCKFFKLPETRVARRESHSNLVFSLRTAKSPST